MISFLTLTVIFHALFILFAYVMLGRRPKNFPPGPMCLPILGTIHLTKVTAHTACLKLSQKYGPILGMKFASEWAVVLHGAKLIRDCFNDGVFNGRHASEGSSFILGDEYGIMQASGNIWKEQRRFSIRTLRDFGFGKTSMEDLILDEATEFSDWCRVQNGAPLELNRRFSLAVVNSLWRMMTGVRYEHGDKHLTDILDKLESTQNVLLDSKNPLKVALLFFYPRIARFFPHYTGWNTLVQTAKSKTDMFERIIREHTETLEMGNPRDFVDKYLEEVRRTDDMGSSFHPSIGEHSLRSVISDLFVAGSDTMASTLAWTIVYLLNYPKVQEELHRELDSVLGSDRSPRLSDRKKDYHTHLQQNLLTTVYYITGRLPYMECVIMEVLRSSSIVPVGVSHVSMEDTKLGSFDIPKGTLVFGNLYQVHHDPEIWGDPNEFRPDRFLNADGSCMKRHDSLMPFGAGRRVCMGENLAMDTLFLFITVILQKFELITPKGMAKPSLNAVSGQITAQPVKFQVSMIARK